MTQISDLIYIDSAGYHCADYPAFLTWIQGKYKGIYGQDVYLGSDSQDGQFLATLAQAYYDSGQVGASYYNSISPATAVGVGLARNVKINGLSKLIPSNSTVDLTITGVAGTTLTGCIAVDTLQQQWSIPLTTIPNAGTIVVTATAVSPGAIQALPNTVTGIYTPTRGWQTVNNTAAATTGAPVESDAALRNRQIKSVAIPAQTVLSATVGGVENVAGVTEVAPYENDTGSTDANGLPAHSISLVVNGGIDAAVAAAIQRYKTPGTQTYGTTNVAVVDSRGMPLTINFYRPTQATIGVEVTVVVGTGWNSATKAIIQAAMAAAVTAYLIGGDVIITQLYNAAYLYGTPQFGTFTVSQIRLKKNAGSFASSDIQLAFNEIPICAIANVTVLP